VSDLEKALETLKELFGEDSRETRALRSVNVFDPEIAYAYSDAIAEFDYLYIEDDKPTLIEELSSPAQEWSKVMRNLLLSSNLPPVEWFSSSPPGLSKWFRVRETDRCGRERARLRWDIRKKEITEALTLASEVANLLLYSELFLAPSYASKLLGDLKNSRELLRGSNVTNRGNEALEVLAKAGVIVVFLQFGIGERSTKQIADFIKLVAKKSQCYSNGLVVAIATNKQLKDQHKEELKSLKGFLADKSTKVEEVSVEKENKEKNEESWDAIKKRNQLKPECPYVVGILVQDWSKELLRTVFETDVLDAMLVVPMVFYFKTPSTQGRLFEAQTIGRISEKDLDEFLKLKVVARWLKDVKAS